MGVTIPCDRRHPKASAWLCAALEGCEPAPQSAGASHASTCPLPTPMPASSGASRARSHAATGAGRPAGTIPSGPTLRDSVPAATRRAQRQPWLGGGTRHGNLPGNGRHLPGKCRIYLVNVAVPWLPGPTVPRRLLPACCTCAALTSRPSRVQVSAGAPFDEGDAPGRRPSRRARARLLVPLAERQLRVPRRR